MSKNPNNERFLQGYRGLRGPAWRLELARDLPANRLHRLVRKADPDVRDVHHYRQLQMRGDPGRTRAKAIYPLIAAAYALSQDKEKSAAAMLLTVGGCRRDEIAVRLAIDEVVLQKWERLFFDVRESREAVGWIHIHVIEKALVEEVGKWNEMIAAGFGALSDALKAQGFTGEASIAGFPNFEHLEFKGQERVGPFLDAMKRLVEEERARAESETDLPPRS